MAATWTCGPVSKLINAFYVLAVACNESIGIVTPDRRCRGVEVCKVKALLLSVQYWQRLSMSEATKGPDEAHDYVQRQGKPRQSSKHVASCLPTNSQCVTKRKRDHCTQRLTRHIRQQKVTIRIVVCSREQVRHAT